MRHASHREQRREERVRPNSLVFVEHSAGTPVAPQSRMANTRTRWVKWGLSTLTIAAGAGSLLACQFSLGNIGSEADAEATVLTTADASPDVATAIPHATAADAAANSAPDAAFSDSAIPNGT